MLDQFTVSRTFNNLTARVHVDRARQEASVTISFARRIDVVPYHEVDEPAKAEAWLAKDTGGEHGSWLEFHALMCARDPLWLVPVPFPTPTPTTTKPKGKS